MTVLTIMRYVRGDFVVTGPATPVKHQEFPALSLSP
jgi:hypothetical protein